MGAVVPNHSNEPGCVLSASVRCFFELLSSGYKCWLLEGSIDAKTFDVALALRMSFQTNVTSRVPASLKH